MTSSLGLGPAASLRSHSIAMVTGTPPHVIPGESGKSSKQQQLDRFESHLEAIRGQLERCLTGIADNKDNLKDLRQYAFVGVDRVNSVNQGNPFHLPSSDLRPQGFVSEQWPAQQESHSGGAPLESLISTASQRQPKEAACSLDEDPTLPLESLKERRRRSGHSHRNTALDLKRTKSLITLSDVTAKPHRQRRRSKFEVDLWRILDEPSSSCQAIWANRINFCLICVSLILTLLDSAIDPTFCIEALIIHLFCDCMFSLEFLARLYSCPSRKVFLTEVYTLSEMIASLPILVVRANCSPSETLEPSTWQYLVLVVFAPLLRLLMMLRRFEQIQLQLSAFRATAEAMPVMVYTLLILILGCAAILFVVEPRWNMPSFGQALWLTIVTCYTVGYGDELPASLCGRCVMCCLMFVSCLYMAIPIGIVGDAFSRVWAQREALLLVRRMSTRLRFAKVTASDIPALFHKFDTDENGMINRAEFLRIIESLCVNLDDARAIELFNIIDADESGEITDEEFVRVLYPSDFKNMYNALNSVVDITKHVATSAMNTPHHFVTFSSETAHRAYRASLASVGRMSQSTEDPDSSSKESSQERTDSAEMSKSQGSTGEIICEDQSEGNVV